MNLVCLFEFRHQASTIVNIKWIVRLLLFIRSYSDLVLVKYYEQNWTRSLIFIKDKIFESLQARLVICSAANIIALQ